MQGDLDRDAADAGAPGLGLGFWYVLSLVVLAGALAVEFFAAYELLLDHPAHSPRLLTRSYGALALGFVVLAAQAGIVFAGLMRPIRENAREIARLTRSLDQHCHMDELTRALNRTAFDHAIEGDLDAVRRYGQALCAIMLDVDRFRAVNDRLGYEAGDRVLAELAQVLHRHIRKADTLYRWRSGRFLVLAPQISLEQGRAFAAKLREVVGLHGFQNDVRLGMTAGVAAATSDDSPETFVNRLKADLSQAKDQAAASQAA